MPVPTPQGQTPFINTVPNDQLQATIQLVVVQDIFTF